MAKYHANEHHELIDALGEDATDEQIEEAKERAAELEKKEHEEWNNSHDEMGHHIPDMFHHEEEAWMVDAHRLAADAVRPPPDPTTVQLVRLCSSVAFLRPADA